MLRGIFNLDNPVMRFLGRIADLMLLNLLFIVCSLPIVTIGASLSAMYYCLFKIKDEEEGYIIKKFFHSFRDNLKQATAMWLIMLVFFAILFLEFLMYREAAGTAGSVVRSIVLIGLIFWYLITTYAFALQSKFYNTIKNTFHNAVLLMFANGPRSIAIIALTAAVIAFTLMQKEVIVLWNLILAWILIGFSGIATVNVQLLYPVIKKLMPEDAGDEVTPDNAFSVDESADLTNLGYGPAEEASGSAEDGPQMPVEGSAQGVPAEDAAQDIPAEERSDGSRQEQAEEPAEKS